MYRTFYYTSTGKIVISRRMSDDNVTKRLAEHTDQSYINAYCLDPDNYKVDLETLSIVENVQTRDYTFWLRQRRNARLIECDWTVVADSPLSDSKKAEWQTYRQALRDLPASYSNLSDKNNVTWPNKPS